MVFSSRSSEEEDDRVRAPSRRVKVPAPARVAKNSSRLHASQVPPRQLREKGKQVMEQLMKNYPACLDVEDDVDYSPIVEPLFRQASQFEQVVLNATTLADYYIQRVPYTATVLARQALDQFILLFPEDQRMEMNRKATIFEPYSLSYDPSELTREFGRVSC